MTQNMNIKFETSEENIEFYVAIMALGLLHSIKNKTLSSDIGIWSLGRPRFWNTLEKEKLISKELLSIIQTLDELSTIEELSLSFDKEIDKLIDRINLCLKKVNKRNSYIMDSKII